MELRNVLITGASSGIGLSVAQYLSRQQYRIVLVARNAEKLNDVANSLNGEKVVIPFDLNKLSDIKNIFEICREQGIKLDALIHCAGINNDMPICVNDIDVMHQVTTVNYYAFVELGKYFGKKKYSNEGASIVAISSTAADSCAKGMCTYSASKAALNASVKVMAKEYLKRKQRVNAIMPSFVATPMAQEMDKRLGDLNQKLAAQPLGLIEPIDVAYMVEFLISEKAKYITGACIPISGGAIW